MDGLASRDELIRLLGLTKSLFNDFLVSPYTRIKKVDGTQI